MLSILKVVEVIENGFADVEGFGAAGTLGEFVQALFDRLGEGWLAWGVAIQVWHKHCEVPETEQSRARANPCCKNRTTMGQLGIFYSTLLFDQG